MSSDAWKDAMFVTHADLFAQVLAAKQVAPDFRTLLNPEGATLAAALDLGCGTGRLLHHLGNLATTVIGLDYSPALLRHAAERNVPPNGVLVRGDFRQLESQFVAPQFDLITRAYTSLGYFDHATEASIAAQCLQIAKPGCRFLVDTFNAAWFQQNGRVSRTTHIGTFSLIENYVWNSREWSVDAHWRYLLEDGEAIDMPFALEGYDAGRVTDLLEGAGWAVESLLSGYDRSLPLADQPNAERIVAVAVRR